MALGSRLRDEPMLLARISRGTLAATISRGTTGGLMPDPLLLVVAVVVVAVPTKLLTQLKRSIVTTPTKRSCNRRLATHMLGVVVPLADELLHPGLQRWIDGIHTGSRHRAQDQ